ncbi:hypothetical protein CKA32_005970 [Geitlerinema sp. FC II]|nr:hypothetical protein CKA32_005970 [Geitlerinema sp. FC II]
MPKLNSGFRKLTPKFNQISRFLKLATMTGALSCFELASPLFYPSFRVFRGVE